MRKLETLFSSPCSPPSSLSLFLSPFFSRAAVIRSCCTYIGILSRPGLGVVRAAPETSESIRNSCGQFDSWARHRGNLRNPYSNRCIACAITCMKDPEVVCTHGRNGQYYYCYAKRRHSSGARVNFPSCNWQITHRRKSWRVDVTNTGTQLKKRQRKKIASSFLTNSLEKISIRNLSQSVILLRVWCKFRAISRFHDFENVLFRLLMSRDSCRRVRGWDRGVKRAPHFFSTGFRKSTRLNATPRSESRDGDSKRILGRFTGCTRSRRCGSFDMHRACTWFCFRSGSERKRASELAFSSETRAQG